MSVHLSVRTSDFWTLSSPPVGGEECSRCASSAEKADMSLNKLVKGVAVASDEGACPGLPVTGGQVSSEAVGPQERAALPRALPALCQRVRALPSRLRSRGLPSH